jgi:hypothetical protein
VASRPLEDLGIAINVYLHNIEYLQEAGSPHDRETIHLLLAITLCHVLVHLMWMFRCKGGVYPYAQLQRLSEPLASV